MTPVKIIIKRGTERNSDFTASLGEPIYCTSTKELFVGDGETNLANLQPIQKLNNLVRGEDGKLYQVNIKSDGSVEAIPLVLHLYSTNNPQAEIYVSDDKIGIEGYLARLAEIRGEIRILKHEETATIQEVIDKCCPHKIGQKIKCKLAVKVKNSKERWGEYTRVDKIGVCSDITFNEYDQNFRYRFKMLTAKGQISANSTDNMYISDIEWLDEYIKL